MLVNGLSWCLLLIVMVIVLNRITITYYKSREKKYGSYNIHRIKAGKIIYILIHYENIFTHQSHIVLDIGDQNKFILDLCESIELIRYNLVEQRNKILLELQFYNHKLFYLLDKITMQDVLLDPIQQDDYDLIVRMTNKISIH